MQSVLQVYYNGIATEWQTGLTLRVQTLFF